jgi:hypothetical protein
MKERGIEIKSQSHADFIALMTVAVAAGYQYHGLTTVEGIASRYPFSKYPVNSIYIGNPKFKEIMGNYEFNNPDSPDAFNLPEDFTTVINLLNDSSVVEPIMIKDVGDYTATVTPTGIQVGCQFITLAKFDELAKAVNQVRDDT